MRQLLFFLVVALIAPGCANDDGPTTVCNPVPVSQEEDIIDAYIDQNGFTMQTTASGLRYSIETAGSGDNIMYGDTIELEFQGALLNGTIFDAGTIGPFILSEGALIPGFEEGLLLLNEGSEAIMILPSTLGYGCFPPQGSIIGDNEILIFEVNILTVDS